MKLVVGLGNPGIQYKNTKHNVGFWVIDEVACREKIKITKRKFNSLYAEAKFNNNRYLLVKPLTYMNLSGKAVKNFVDYYKIKPEEIFVIFDDINLRLGTLRIRPEGSAGGHKGLQSIIEALGMSRVVRLRVGIDPGECFEDLSNYVLSGFKRKEDKVRIKEMVDIAAESVLFWLDNGTVSAMNEFNKKKEGNVSS